MIGTVNSGGGGATVELPDTDDRVLGPDAVVHVSYDTGGFTTGHGLADGKFIIPATGYYRVTAMLGFQFFSPGDSTTVFHAYLDIDGDHGFPDAGDPRRAWAYHYENLYPDNTVMALWTPTLTMTEEFTAGELVACWGRFDCDPVGESAWAGIISFEIATA